MNQELYRDMCLMVAPLLKISAKRLVAGNVSSEEFMAIRNKIDLQATVPSQSLYSMQLVRLSVSEKEYYQDRNDIPFDDWVNELKNRKDNQ